MGSHKALLVAGLCSVLVVATYVLRDRSPDPSPAPASATTAVANGWSLLRLGAEEEDAALPDPNDQRRLRAPADLWHDLFTDGSLREASLDGDWGRWDGRELTPGLALRQRFDQLLTTIGEASPEELRSLVAWLAERDLGAAGAQAVLAVWDRYLTLQKHPFREGLDLSQPQRWSQVLQEHQRVRRDILGAAWADAFYREDEAALQQRFGQMHEGQTPMPEAPPSWIEPAPSGVTPEQWHSQRADALGWEAAQRLREEELSQAEWESRLTQARAEIARLTQAPELSSTQRAQRIQRWVDEHFQRTERLRANALLGL